MYFSVKSLANEFMMISLLRDQAISDLWKVEQFLLCLVKRKQGAQSGNLRLIVS